MKDIKEVLKPFFYPENIAIIGASTKTFKFGNWQLKSLIDFGFNEKGNIYPVNPHGIDIYGLKSYKKISDVPDHIDLVYITVPFNKVLDSFKECVDLKIKAVIILTAGFKETGVLKAIEAENELSRLTKETGTRIIGPNCFGVYSPEGGLTLLPGQEFSKESGEVAFLSQSGGVAVEMVRLANSWGIRFSKVISYGNACDISATNLIDYLASDPKTKIIAGYFEGMKNGKDFLKVIKNLKKPLIMWKGGLTEAGSRASFSHTGFLVSKPEIWEGMFKQHPNLIKTDSFEELFDTMLAIQKLPPPSGRNLGIIGGGGAIGVALSDMANRLDLNVPKLLPAIKAEIQKFLILDGSNAANPVDLGNPVYKFSTAFKNILFTFGKDKSIDIIINDQITTHIENGDLRAVQRTLKKFKADFKNKPLIVTLRQISKRLTELDQEEKNRKARDYYLAQKIPVYESFSRAVRAISNYVQYYERIQQFSNQK
ncbi:MAG: CoA-binding protein [Candidatus Helarchaeota archaeon]